MQKDSTSFSPNLCGHRLHHYQIFYIIFDYRLWMHFLILIFNNATEIVIFLLLLRCPPTTWPLFRSANPLVGKRNSEWVSSLLKTMNLSEVTAWQGPQLHRVHSILFVNIQTGIQSLFCLKWPKMEDEPVWLVHPPPGWAGGRAAPYTVDPAPEAGPSHQSHHQLWCQDRAARAGLTRYGSIFLFSKY